MILHAIKFSKRLRLSALLSPLYTFPLSSFLECGCDVWKCSSHHVVDKAKSHMIKMAEQENRRSLGC